jgi:hypothetical protein
MRNEILARPGFPATRETATDFRPRKIPEFQENHQKPLRLRNPEKTQKMGRRLER